MDTQVYSTMESNHSDYCSNTQQGSYDPRVTLDKYLPAEWHIYVLPRLRMGVILGKVIRQHYLPVWHRCKILPRNFLRPNIMYIKVF